MKQKKERRAAKMARPWLARCLGLIVVGLIILIPRTSPREATGIPPAPPLPIYSKEEIHRFWDAHMNSLIVEQLGGGRHPIPEVNGRYRTLLERIRQKFPRTPLKVMAVEKFNSQSSHIYMGVNTEEPVPRLAVYVPAFMRRWRSLLPDPTAQKHFESSVVVGVFHEMEHMTHPMQGTLSRKELVVDEARTWAETCSASMPILLERGYPLGSDHRAYFEEWQRCGRANNACWQKFIEEVYDVVAPRK